MEFVLAVIVFVIGSFLLSIPFGILFDVMRTNRRMTRSVLYVICYHILRQRKRLLTTGVFDAPLEVAAWRNMTLAEDLQDPGFVDNDGSIRLAQYKGERVDYDRLSMMGYETVPVTVWEYVSRSVQRMIPVVQRNV